MLQLFRGVLLTMIGLAVLVVVQQAFGMTTTIIVTGVGFLGYVLWLTLRQMREEGDDQ